MSMIVHTYNQISRSGINESWAASYGHVYTATATLIPRVTNINTENDCVEVLVYNQAL